MLMATGWWLAVAPVDLRYGIDRLLMIVRDELGRDLRDGAAYIFRNRVGTRVKVVCMDGQGVWLSTRGLHEGRFHWPCASDAAWSLTPEQGGQLATFVQPTHGTTDRDIRALSWRHGGR